MSPARQEVTSVLDPEERGTLQEGKGEREGGMCQPSTAACTKLRWSHCRLPHTRGVMLDTGVPSVAPLKPLPHWSSKTCR